MRCDDVIFVPECRWPQKWVVSKSSRTRLGGGGKAVYMEPSAFNFFGY